MYSFLWWILFDFFSNLNKWLESKFDILSLVLESKIMIQCGTSTVLTSLQAIHARGKGARDKNCWHIIYFEFLQPFQFLARCYFYPKPPSWIIYNSLWGEERKQPCGGMMARNTRMCIEVSIVHFTYLTVFATYFMWLCNWKTSSKMFFFLQ